MLAHSRAIFGAGALLWVASHADAQDIRVTSSKLYGNLSGRVSWGAKNNLLAFDRPHGAGYFEVYTSNPDGSNVICLTCNASQFPYSKGDPVWDLSNNYMAIQIQTVPVDPNSSTFSLYTPGSGVGNDLYIMDAAGQNYWPVTQGAKGVLHPRFSHDGTKLLWVQRESGNIWSLRIADYLVVAGVPQVTGIQELPPCGHSFCETGGFSLDDSTVFFTGNLEGQGENGIDVYSYNLSTGALANLTNTPNQWDEFPYSFPNANKLIWMSGALIPGVGLQTEYWMMDYDGSNKVQLTYYNDQRASSLYLGGISCARMEWSPDGTQMAAHLIPNGTPTADAGTIYIINVESASPTFSAASFLRPPLGTESITTSFFGNLAATLEVATSLPLPTTLGGLSITVTDSEQVSRPAPLYFASPNQANWLLPRDTALGPAMVELTDNQNQTLRATIDVETVGPGLFTQTASGKGPASGYVLVFPNGATQPSATIDLTSGSCTLANCALNPVSLDSNSAAYLVLFGTGLRFFRRSTVVQIGNQKLPVSFAGAQGFFAGVDQINVQLPASLAGAGRVNLSLLVDGQPSNAVQLQIQ